MAKSAKRAVPSKALLAARRVKKPPFDSMHRCLGCAEHPSTGGKREMCRICARTYFDKWTAANNSITGGGTPYRACTGSASDSEGGQR